MASPVAVVVPTIREDCLTRWLAEWRQDLAGRARVIIVEDNPQRSFTVPGDVEHYCWADVDRDLGDKAWIIPRRTSAVRSYGYWLACQGGAEVIWTLDDDCYPEDGQRGRYLDRLGEILSSEVPQGQWHNTIGGSGFCPRGFPYEIRDERRPVMVHHGLWSNVPDFDGVTQKANPQFRLPPSETAETVPYGQFFPFCIMNVAFRAEMVPALYMLLMGRARAGGRWGFDRFDDIWAGLFVKRITDHLGYAITSGAPGISHSKASDADANIALEAAGVKAHEDFWRYAASVPLAAGTVAGCYRELAAGVGAYDRGPYWKNLGDAMAVWAGLFGEDDS